MDPVDPVELVDSVGLVVPVDLVDAMDTVDPGELVNSVGLVGPVDPVDLVDAMDPVNHWAKWI